MSTGLRASHTAKLLRPAFVCAACGLLAVATGASALLGWHIGNVALVRLLPGLPLMAYFTALCFVVSGLGLAAYAWRWPRAVPVVCGAAVAALGWGWGLEHFLGWPLGTGALEARFPLIAGFPPTPPAPAAMACFGLFGIAIAMLGIPAPRTFKRLTIWVCGALALTPFAMVLGSYASGFLKIQDWNAANVMAVNTLAGMMFLGTGLFAAQLMTGPRLVDDVLLPLPVLIVVGGTALLFWFALLTARNGAIRSRTDALAQSLSSIAAFHINAPVRALERMKMRWETRGGTPYAEWESDADAYVGSEKVFAAIEWADPSGKIAWCRPESEFVKVRGFDLRSDPHWSGPLERAYRERATALSPTIDLRIGGRGFIAYCPLFPDGKFDGWLLGVIRVDDLMKIAIDGAGLSGETVSIFEDGRLVFGPESPPKGGFSQGEAAVDIRGHQWRFVVTVSASFLLGYNLPAVTLALAVLLAVVSAAAVRAFQQIAWKNREIHAANRLLARYANEDYLTGLLNRRNFDEALETEIRRAQRNRAPLAVIMADVDFFKKYNDHYGHQAGDECLRRVAGAFRQAARRPTDFVGRYGGEEFCAVLAGTDAGGARLFAEHIRSSIEAMNLPHELNPAGRVTASFGIAGVNFAGSDGGISGKDLVSQADAALYAAKSAGRNTVR